MNVQPYFPEPITVPGNIANADYGERLRYVRILVLMLSICFAVVAVALYATPRELPPRQAAVLILGLLAALSLTRRLAPSGLWDNILSGSLLVVLLLALGAGLRYWSDSGLPLYTLAIAACCPAAYTLFSGRDFSFVGGFVLSMLATALASAAYAVARGQPLEELWLPVTLSGVGLFYLYYDLASLLQRRRKGEEVAALADLFRDSLNVLSYGVRVVRHWKRFNI